MPHSYQEVTPAQRQFGKIALLVVVLTLIGNVVVFAYLRPYGILRELSPLAEAREHIHNRYVGEVEDQDLIDAALRGMADALGDENTQYFSAEQLSAFNEHVGGSFTGIGAYVGEQDGYLLIINPFDDSPAMKAGLLPGDLILEIDGEDIYGLSLDKEVVPRLKGEAGTTVKVRVRHPDGEEADLTITRAQIVVPSVVGYRRNPGDGYHYMLDPEQKIAYIRLTQFGDSSLKEVQETLKKLKAQGMKALIFDLRNNGGGLLDGAAGISDLFLAGGKTIVSTKGKGTATESLISTNDTLLPNLPLVILINENSASASEIVAGAMLDNNRALLVGSRSFGKGSVQQLLPLSDGTSAIKLTTAYWYLPSGKMIHRKADATEWGVDPSPGNYLPVDPESMREMLIKRREVEVDDPFARLDGQVTPQWLREQLLDEPMAAGLEAAQQMLESDGWPKVGIDRKAALAEPSERERLEHRREELNELLKQVDEEIEQLPAESEPSP
ncbi:MAG: S41 family peptidase [Planctomycetota bacterium]